MVARLMESVAGLHVLVLDDDPLVRRGVSRALRVAGHDVVTLERCSGVRELSRGFDVAILDLELPDGSGVEVASELLALGTTQGVVFFSGAGDPVLLRRAERLGEVVAKSTNLDSLLAAVDSSQRRARAHTRRLRPTQRTARR
ncbi:MAG: response regulator [Polyangiaceae bacterium]